MQEQMETLKRQLEESRAEAQSQQDKLRKLASNPFTVLGEVRVTGSSVSFSILGDLPAEPRLGLPPGTYPQDP